MSELVQLTDVEARAAAATPGPWRRGTTGVPNGDHWFVAAEEVVCWIRADDGDNEDQRPLDAEFIAQCRTDVPALTAAVRGVLALHVPWYEVDGVRHDHTVPVYGAAPRGHICRIGFTSYDNCLIDPESSEESEHYVLACRECRCATDEGEEGYLFWPCPTVRAITDHVEYPPRRPICPECQQGKHGNCDGTAWNERADDIDDCTCPDPTHKENAQP